MDIKIALAMISAIKPPIVNPSSTNNAKINIVKGYKSKVAAGFWQGVAKMFGENLKTPYDPKGADTMTEYLIEKWEDGQFEYLYFSIFGEWPKQTEIPLKYR